MFRLSSFGLRQLYGAQVPFSGLLCRRRVLRACRRDAPLTVCEALGIARRLRQGHRESWNRAMSCAMLSSRPGRSAGKLTHRA